MSEDDVLFGYPAALVHAGRRAGQRLGGVSADGRQPPDYYRLKKQVDRWGLEALRVRERRRPRMPNEIGPHLEQRIIAFALAHPGFGPRRISAELAREKWGGLRISEHGVWRVLVRVGLNTRTKRLALIARHRDPYERKPSAPPPARHIDAARPGQKVGVDCFFIGRLSGTTGSVCGHGDRRRLRLRLGAAAHQPPQPPRAKERRDVAAAARCPLRWADAARSELPDAEAAAPRPYVRLAVWESVTSPR
jgi:hypothetical protein